MSLSVYSEFHRVDLQGKPLNAPAGYSPREILSPLWARNGHVVYRVVVKVPANTWFHVFIAQNPSNTVPARLYREIFVESDGKLYPNRLIPVSHPYTGKLPDVDFPREGQTAVPFLLDVEIPKDAEVFRFRLELQLNVDDRWVIYPLEPRIGDVRYPSLPPLARPDLSPAESGDAAAALAVRQYYCGVKPVLEKREDLTTHDFIYRGALQDLALASQLEARLGTDFLRSKLPEFLGIPLADFCQGKPPRSPHGPEWFLPLRTFLLRQARDPEQPDP